MSSKFRHDSSKRKYTDRTFIRRFLGCGLIFLLLVAGAATLLAFYLMIQDLVGDSIEIGYMKNLTIRSKTLAQLLANDLEMIGSDLSVSAHILSDLVSRPSSIADVYYKRNFDSFVKEGAALSDCKNDPCSVDGREYVVSFNGKILQNDVHKE